MRYRDEQLHDWFRVFLAFMVGVYAVLGLDLLLGWLRVLK